MKASVNPSANDGAELPALDVPPIFDVQALVDAAFMLANLKRVFDDISNADSIDPEFSKRLAEHCPAWADPAEHDNGTMTELLRVASARCRDFGKALDSHERELRNLERQARKASGASSFSR